MQCCCPDCLVRQWTDARFAFAASVWSARVSLKSAANLVLRLGLPFAVLFVAVNPIWGFTWYFNTESWASGMYQKMAELRVDMAGRHGRRCQVGLWRE